MNIDEFGIFLEKVRERLNKLHPMSERELVMARSLKVQEELGELVNEILINMDLARKDKLENRDKENISKEWVDVLASVLLLGMELGVDFGDALEKRMKVIGERLGIYSNL